MNHIYDTFIKKIDILSKALEKAAEYKVILKLEEKKIQETLCIQ